MSKQLEVGVIGLGRIGTHHVQTLLGLDGVSVSVTDADGAAKLQELPGSYTRLVTGAGGGTGFAGVLRCFGTCFSDKV